MGNPLKKLMFVLKTGMPQEVKEAQKGIEQFWNHDYISNKEENGPKFKVFVDEIRNFKSWDDKHKPYFIYNLKWAMHTIFEEYFDEIARFLLMYVQHPLGTVRQAVLNAAEYLMVEITYTMELAEKNIVDSVWQEKNLKNIKRFYSFVSAAESLLTEYREPKFNRYKYVCAFPPSVYKSLQMLIMEKIFYSESLERLYKVCESKIFGPDHDNKSQMSKRKFLEKREDAEKRAVELLNELKTDLSFGELKKLIYSGKKMFDVLKNTKLLDNVKNDDEANKILKIFMDVWNYFPHKTLNGLSPLEKSHNLQEDCEEGEENQGEKLDDFFTREHGHA